MLTKILHRLAAHPTIYNLIQKAVGADFLMRNVAAELQAHTGTKSTSSLILDFGGGTGTFQRFCPPGSRYICLDLDPLKLSGLQSDQRAVYGILADGTQPPVRSQSADVVLCTAVSHHLTDAQIGTLFTEMLRVLAPNGVLIFFDALAEPRRFLSRFMWKYDRGSSPHSYDQLMYELAQHGDIVSSHTITLLHRYLLCVVKPQARHTPIHEVSIE